MAFARQLASHEPSVIKEALFSILNLDKITPKDVLDLDKEFKLATNKDAFIAEFEALDGAPPKRDNPGLFQRWTHYCWIRLQLIFLINQKAALNLTMDTKLERERLSQAEGPSETLSIKPLTAQEVRQRFASETHILPSAKIYRGMPFDEFQKRIIDPPVVNTALTVPAMMDTVEKAIQEDFLRGTSIADSIQILRKMKLQVVGTEHPTDPLSQEARNILSQLAQALDKKHPSKSEIKRLLLQLQTTDAIPPSKRSVEEEVRRNMSIALDKLYDNIPYLVQAILSAYKKYYGAETYRLHESDLLNAIEGLLRDASWPGFDADGNKNIIAAIMQETIQLLRVHAAEKHSAVLEETEASKQSAYSEETIVDMAKKIERDLRTAINDLNLALSKLIADQPVDIRLQADVFKTKASQFLIDRKFPSLLKHYKDWHKNLASLQLDANMLAELIRISDKQFILAKELVDLTRFSGTYTVEIMQKDEEEQSDEQSDEYADKPSDIPSLKTKDIKHKGDLQAFREIFLKYKDIVDKNADAIQIEGLPATQFVLQHFNKLVETHADLLNAHPELYLKMRYFGIQLHSFGMTYGEGHVRQDSSVFMKVWNAILADLNSDSTFSTYELFKPFNKARIYSDLSTEEKTALDSQSNTLFELLKSRTYSELSNKERLEFHKKLYALFKPTQSRAYQRLSEQERLDLSKKLDELLKPVADKPYTNLSTPERNNLVKDLYESFKPRYLDLSEDQRVDFHKQLQDGNSESKNILEAIHLKHKNSNYLLEPKYKNDLDFEWVRIELDRMRLALFHDDMVRKFIISNSESAANPLEVESLKAIFPKRQGQQELKVVPLLEKREDLENFKTILADHIKALAQQKRKSDPTTLFKLFYQVMLGFSDTERVSGPTALLSIQEALEEFIKLAHSLGVIDEFYYGSGQDITRGGPKRHDPTTTVQGRGRSNAFSTLTSTRLYRESQFYRAHEVTALPSKLMELTHLPSHLQDLLASFTQAGTSFYEHLHDTENGLGKLMGLMLGQGSQWMSNTLNSSSRPSQRETTENTGDRTSSVQTGGVRPEPYIHIDKMRAITAVQTKEFLQANINFIGPSYGLKWIGLQNAERLYHASQTFRDVVEKTLLGESTRDLTFLAQALFADHPELIPTNREQIQAWAKECETTYSERLKSMNIEALCKDPKNRLELLTMLSRLFAYIKEESLQTQELLFELKRSIHQKATTTTLEQPTDLLFHVPAWQEQTKDIIKETEPLNYIFARMCHHVATGKNLDQVYPGLNKQTISKSKLGGGVASLIADVGCGLMAAKDIPGFIENIHHDYREDLRQSVTRAEEERSKYSPALFKETQKQVAPLLEESYRKRMAAF